MATPRITADVVSAESEKKTVVAPIKAAADIVWQ